MKYLSLAAAALLTLAPPASAEDRQQAVFAGGCFWCVESDFDKLDGVLETTSGFAGGTLANPTYREVTAGGTGHREVVQIIYDADIVDFATLSEYLLRTVDVTDAGGQFCDRGFGYSTAIYAQNLDQLSVAATVRTTLQGELGQPIVTEIVDGGTFYPAEEYHQDYYQKRPVRYRLYRASCGRDAQVERVWGAHAAYVN